MRERWLILVLVFSLVVNIAAVGTIGYHWWKERRSEAGISYPPGPMMAPLCRMLALNPVQMRKLGEQSRQTAEQMRRIEGDFLGERMRLMQLLRTPHPDSTALEGVLQEMTLSQMALERRVVWNILRMKQVLTPAQQEEFLRMLEKRCRWRPGLGPGHLRSGP